MGCEDFQPHLADHLEGSLPPDVAAHISAHLRECPACAEEIELLAETWRMLGDIPAAQPDSAAIRARVDAAIAGYRHALDAPSLNGGPDAVVKGYAHGGATLAARMWQWNHVALQTAAAVLLLSAGVLLGRQTAPQPPADPQLSVVRDELH